MEHEWSYMEGPDPRQCMNCGGTDEKQRCVPRPKGRKADDGRRCIGCPAMSPEFVVQPNGRLTSVCVGCAQAKSYWVYVESTDRDPIEMHPTLDAAVRGAEGIVQRGHLKSALVWDAATLAVIARSLEPSEVETARAIGLLLGFDDDDETKHQYRHLCWPGMRGGAICKSDRLWFHGPIRQDDRPLVDCEACLGQWRVLADQHLNGALDWTTRSLLDVVGRLAEDCGWLFEVFSAANDLLWAIENPEDAKTVPYCKPEELRARLLAALNRVPGRPASAVRQCRLERAVDELLAALPKCERCKRTGVERPATHQSLDAAGDSLYTCDEHSRPGGFDDTGPFPLSWAKCVKQANALLGSDGPSEAHS
jgi:hypothetical protein